MTVRQDSFTEALLSPDLDVPAGLVDPKGRPAGKRFNVYRNNVAASLISALETGFPAVRKIVGENNFRILASTYLRRHPPATPLMMHYGAELPGFIEGFGPLRKLGYLPDVARLELALRASYHAADADTLDPACLAALDPDALTGARLRPAPATRLVRSPWPIHAIWRFNMVADAQKPEMRADAVLIHRAAFDPEITLLNPGGGAFVAALADNAPIGTALERAQEEIPDFDLARTLSILLSTGALTGLETET